MNSSIELAVMPCFGFQSAGHLAGSMVKSPAPWYLPSISPYFSVDGVLPAAADEPVLAVVVAVVPAVVFAAAVVAVVAAADVDAAVLFVDFESLPHAAITTAATTAPTASPFLALCPMCPPDVFPQGRPGPHPAVPIDARPARQSVPDRHAVVNADGPDWTHMSSTPPVSVTIARS